MYDGVINDGKARTEECGGGVGWRLQIRIGCDLSKDLKGVREQVL